VFQAAKNGLEFGSVRSSSVAVTICYCGIVDGEGETNSFAVSAASIKQKIGLEKESRI